MKVILIFIVSCIPNLSWAQKLPHGFTCQDLLDIDSGKLSRTVDGGNTYVTIKRPQARDPFSKALLSFDTSLCHRLSRGEITEDQFDAMHAEKVYQLGGQGAKFQAEKKEITTPTEGGSKPRGCRSPARKSSPGLLRTGTDPKRSIRGHSAGGIAT